MDRPSILKPTLIGGALFGLLGSIPFVNALNCLCCALVMGGGFVAAYLHSSECKKRGLEFGAGQGLRVGLVAGVFYTIVNVIIEGLLSMLIQQDLDPILEKMEEGGAPPEVIEMAERVIEVMSGPGGVLIKFGAVLVIALAFSTIGGLIGGAVFKAEAARPTPPPSMSGGGGPLPGPGA